MEKDSITELQLLSHCGPVQGFSIGGMQTTNMLTFFLPTHTSDPQLNKKIAVGS